MLVSCTPDPMMANRCHQQITAVASFMVQVTATVTANGLEGGTFHDWSCFRESIKHSTAPKHCMRSSSRHTYRTAHQQ